MPSDHEYQPFPDLARRNFTQQLLEVPLMVWLLGIPRAARLLEVGCGRGAALLPLARRCAPAKLAGMDIDAAALDRAAHDLSSHGIDCELVLGDVRRIPFADATFDVVVDFGTCYHIARSEEALREIGRVLAGGGQFVFETPLSQLISHPVRSFGRRLPWPDGTLLRPARMRALWSSRVKT
jgi:ubiquinone/menaquinone biosynthesis C-methylase UbiE